MDKKVKIQRLVSPAGVETFAVLVNGLVEQSGLSSTQAVSAAEQLTQRPAPEGEGKALKFISEFFANAWKIGDKNSVNQAVSRYSTIAGMDYVDALRNLCKQNGITTL
jgi:hypothetical protein